MKKGTFIAILFIGIVSAFFAVLGPLHEVWHWIYATLSGIDARLGWGVTYMDLSKINLATAFAGMFGEIITLTAIFMVLFNKGYFGLATYILGYMSSFIIIVLSVLGGFGMVDIKAALTIAPKTTVDGIYFIWVVLYFLLLALQIGTIIGNNRVFFGKKGRITSNKPKTSNKILTTV